MEEAATTTVDTDRLGGQQRNDRVRMFNICLNGICFCFIFAGYLTLSQTQVASRYLN